MERFISLINQPKQNIHKSDVSLSTRDTSSSPLTPADSSAQGKEHTSVSEELKRAMLGDEFYTRIYYPKAKASKSQPITEELKKTMVGDEFYDRTHNPKLKATESQPVSEDLKRAMVGGDLYNRAHGKEQDLKLASAKVGNQAEKLSKTPASSESPEDHIQEEQKVTLSYKSPSLGKRR